MIRELDRSAIDRCFDPRTLVKARAYVSAGAVLGADWEPDIDRVHGSVMGTRRSPYEVTVDLERAADGHVVAVDTECTCPVSYDCKHAAALLLSVLPGRSANRASRALGVRGTQDTIGARAAWRGAGAARRGAGAARRGAGAARRGAGADQRGAGADQRAAGERGDDVAWDRVFGAMLAPGPGDGRGGGACGSGAPRDDPAGTIGLQFELVVDATPARPAAGPHRGGAPAGGLARVRLRPVLRGASGNWVRTGVAWRTVDYLGSGWSRLRCAVDQLGVLKELRAVSSARARWSYSASTEDVWLDAIGSRRIWDLLWEAEDAGIPLVSAGRAASRVVVHRAEAELLLDASAAAEESGGGFVLTPRLLVGGLEVPVRTGARTDTGGTDTGGTGTGSTGTGSTDTGSTDTGATAITGWLLIGTPPHGVAWWGRSGVASAPGSPALSFARLPELRAAPWRALLGGERIVVPPEDARHFLDSVYPRLRRRLRVESTDGSVDLPEIPDEALILTLGHRDAHRLELSWSTGVPGTSWRERLGDPAHAGYDDATARTVEAARQLVCARPAGRHLSPYGDRLEPDASLGGMDAVRFLTDVLPELEALGGLVVEHTGELPCYREAAEAPTVTLGGAPSEERDWFDLAVEVRVGGELVPFVELFTALATGQSHMLLPSGTYFSLDDEGLRELAQLIGEAKALHGSDGERVRVTRYQASLWRDLERLGVLGAQAAEWDRAVRALATASARAAQPVPAGVKAQLRPYQKIGFDWLVFLYELGLGGILADDMGLGKTLQVLALVCHVRAQGGGDASGGDGPFLVVAPTSVVGNWANECRKFAPGLRVETVTATSTRRRRTLFDLVDGADVVVTSYALFRLEYDEYEKLEWAGLVLDEAQFAKNVHSRAYQRAKTLPVRFKLAMTGTPMENHLLELWALTSITAPGLLGSAERFTEYYRRPIERHRDEDRLALLRRRIQPLLLRRSKEQVAHDLPDKQEQVVELELAPRHRKLYQTYLQRERQKVLGLLDDVQRNRFEILKSLTVLRQAALSAALVDPSRGTVPSTKLDALSAMLDEVVADGHRVLVFSQFTRFLGMARDRVRSAGIPHCYLDGRTRRRTAVLAEFRAGDVPVFLISLKAGGFGLNLTEADYCILLDPWWNPATEAQAIDRVHRIGQTKNVIVYRLVAKETIEEKVMALKAKKAALFSSVVGGGGFESGALTAADIRGLLD